MSVSRDLQVAVPATDVADRVMRMATCPVLTVHPNQK
jgi:hypothetical protein